MGVVGGGPVGAAGGGPVGAVGGGPVGAVGGGPVGAAGGGPVGAVGGGPVGGVNGAAAVCSEMGGRAGASGAVVGEEARRDGGAGVAVGVCVVGAVGMTSDEKAAANGSTAALSAVTADGIASISSPNPLNAEPKAASKMLPPTAFPLPLFRTGLRKTSATLRSVPCGPTST